MGLCHGRLYCGKTGIIYTTDDIHNMNLAGTPVIIANGYVYHLRNLPVGHPDISKKYGTECSYDYSMHLSGKKLWKQSKMGRVEMG